MVAAQVGCALGSPPPGKPRVAARHNYCMDNYTIQSPLENPGLVPEQREAGFWDCNRLLLVRVKFERRW